MREMALKTGIGAFSARLMLFNVRFAFAI